MERLTETVSSALSFPFSVASFVFAIIVVTAYSLAIPARAPIQGVPGLEHRREKS
jgi:hypothetical protein